jgi:hypothetical protein
MLHELQQWSRERVSGLLAAASGYNLPNARIGRRVGAA